MYAYTHKTIITIRIINTSFTLKWFLQGLCILTPCLSLSPHPQAAPELLSPAIGKFVFSRIYISGHLWHALFLVWFLLLNIYFFEIHS